MINYLNQNKKNKKKKIENKKIKKANIERMTVEDSETIFLNAKVDKNLIAFTVLLTLICFFTITFAFEVGNIILFTLLILGEVFHVFQVIMYMYTIWDMEYEAPRKNDHVEPVDIFVTVAGEPLDIVEETILAIKNIDYPTFNVYILNDGYVAKKENW